MTRFVFAICLLMLPGMAGAEGSEEQVALPDLAADALAEKAGGADRIRGLELSRSYRKGGADAMCATTNAYDSSGFFIGLTYWQVVFTEDGSGVQSLRDVTGLNSSCYSERYEGYGN